LLYRQSDRYRHLVISHGSIPRDVHAEHTAVFDAAMARDIGQATTAIERHIYLTFESIRMLVPEFDCKADAGETNGGVK
jgi:DNA-binding GntR family transcriptional regulator